MEPEILISQEALAQRVAQLAAALRRVQRSGEEDE